MAVIQQHETPDRADARPWTPPVEGVGVKLGGGVGHGSRQVGAQVVIGRDQREVAREALRSGRLGNALGPALPAGRVGECCADRGAVVRAVSMFDVGSRRCVRISGIRRRRRSRVARMAAGLA
jgi:hypothetical protein